MTESAGSDGAAREFAGLLHELDRCRRALSQRATLGVSDLRLLWLFSDGAPRTLKQIAERLGLEQSTVNRQVHAAVQAGLLRSDHTTTPYLISATPAGSLAFERDLNATLDSYQRALDALGADQRSFLDLFRAYIAAQTALAVGGADGVDGTDRT